MIRVSKNSIDFFFVFKEKINIGNEIENQKIFEEFVFFDSRKDNYIYLPADKEKVLKIRYYFYIYLNNLDLS